MNSFKVISKTSVESKTFDLKVGPQKGSGAGIVITRGKLPQHVEKEDADFRGKLKKIQKKVTLTKDNEGVKGRVVKWARNPIVLFANFYFAIFYLKKSPI